MSEYKSRPPFEFDELERRSALHLYNNEMKSGPEIDEVTFST
jgi:hypothetical protein